MNTKPKILSSDLTFEETEESKGEVEVQHLTNDYSYATVLPKAKEATMNIPKDSSNVKVESNTKNIYEDLEEDSFEKYHFQNYTQQFKDAHTYYPKIDESWEIVDFPSNGLFYNVGAIRCRPLKTRSLAKLHTVITNKNFSGLLDILNMYIDMDIRDLTTPDFKFFMFWLRIKSFPSSELVLEWTSKYGNRNNTLIGGNTILDFIKCDATNKQLDEWLAKGYTFPTVRELEFSTVNDLTEEDVWLYDYAKYYKGSTPDEKILEFEKHLDFDNEIQEFKKLFEHGIEEYVYAKDSNFDRLTYIKQLEDKLGFMHTQEQKLSLKSKLSPSEVESYEFIVQMIGIMEAELYKAQNDENMTAEEEKILLPFRSINLLPNVPLTADSE